MDNWLGCLVSGNCRDNLCSSSYGCKAALLTLYILAAGLITLFFDYIWSI
jgi:hypothetical protein